jgi:dihydrodipicolinate synthase/N-acetylneuraminate lyase
MPREWAWSWQVCRAGDVERMDKAQRIADAFRDCTTLASGKRPTLACLKRALVCDGIVSSACVAPGTSALPPDEIARFDDAYAAVKAMAAREIGEPWITRCVRRNG